MINNTEILTAWQRIGWSEATASPYVNILDTDNKTSLSGLLMDKLHPLCSFRNVKETINDSAISTVNINLHLKEWQQSSILKVCNDVFSRKIYESSKTFTDYRVTDFNNKLTGTGKFVGYEICVPQGFVMTIKSFGLFFDSVATKTIYVFNVNKQTALTTKVGTITTVNSEVLTSWDYPLFGKSTTLSQGIYLIGYFQSTENAIEIPLNYNHSICKVQPIIAEPNGVTLPTSVSYSGYTYGLNLIYDIEKDFTQMYLQNTNVFDEAIGYSIITKCLNQVLFSEHMNATIRKALAEISSMSAIFVELNGSGEYLVTKGLDKKYQEEIDNIKKSLFPKVNLTGTMS